MKYIAICGTVGAGKTTLLGRLIDRLGPRAAFHEERPQDNPYINDYYSDSKRWSFHSQVSFLSLYFDDPKWKNESEAEFFFFDRARDSRNSFSLTARFWKIWSSPNTACASRI